jgi:hypothetical protein
MSGGIIILPSLKEFKELLCPPLLKETHERTFDSFHFSTWYFGYPPITIDKAARDLLEFHISSDIGVDKNLCEFSRRNDEFRDQIDSIITVSTKLRGRCLVGSEFAVQLARDEKL